jgi:glycosidase
MADKWWETAVGYVLNPQTFLDTNGDGIGDFPGITQRLPYLKDLGVNLLWLGPIFASPMDDNGYDVSDYKAINPMYGTMEDFDAFLKEAHKLGFHVLLDFSLNHTSDEHPWFQKALKDPKAKERDYYIIRPGKKEGGKLLPPNNWKSFFETSAWERIPGSDDFYLHLFSKKMPDVNWNCPELKEQYYDALRFWLDKGVDGFRLDAIAHLAKDMSFEDGTQNIDSHGLSYDLTKFSNRPELYDILKGLRDEVFSKYPCLIVGEVGGDITPEHALRLVNYNDGVMNMIFHFDTAWNNGAYESYDKSDADIVTDVIQMKDNFMRSYNVLNGKADMPLYWCNHDHPRVLSQYGSEQYRNESAKMLLTTILFLYGTDFIYYGDEIGMSNVHYDSLEDFAKHDSGNRGEIAALQAKGYDDERILHYLNRTSRTNARTPFQWNHKENAGFTTGKPYQKLNDNFPTVNLQDEMEDPYSIVNFYQYAIGFRKDPVINDIVLHGPLSLIDRNHPDVFSYIHEGTEKLMVISNFRPYTVYFSFYFQINDILLHNYGDVIIKDHVFELRPYESFLLKIR